METMMEDKTLHRFLPGQRGDMNVLYKRCKALGWIESLPSSVERRTRKFFNDQPPEIVLELIGIHEGVHGYLNTPTKEMDRLHAMRWKI